MEFHKKGFYYRIGKSIRNAREKVMTQDELGKEVGLTRTSITNIEQGRQRLSIAKLYEISFALGVDVFDLLPKKEELVHKNKAILPEGLGKKDAKMITDILKSVGLEVEQQKREH